MPLTPQDFEIYAGESLAIRTTVTADSNGNTVSDLSGWLIELLTRDSTKTTTTLSVTKSTADYSISTNANTATWVWSGAETANLPRRTTFEVRATDPGGVATVIGYGHVILRNV